ncbi:MAG: hypothetical protein AABW86_00385 [Candidatus Micrarchaeota archaeon]
MLTGIEVCEGVGRINEIAELLERTDLSDAVKEAAQKVIKQKKEGGPLVIVTKYITQRTGANMGGETLPPGFKGPAGQPAQSRGMERKLPA